MGLILHLELLASDHRATRLLTTRICSLPGSQVFG